MVVFTGPHFDMFRPQMKSGSVCLYAKELPCVHRLNVPLQALFLTCFEMFVIKDTPCFTNHQNKLSSLPPPPLFFRYTSPDFLYIRSWLPCIFFSGGVTVGNIGRQLAMVIVVPSFSCFERKPATLVLILLITIIQGQTMKLFSSV